VDHVAILRKDLISATIERAKSVGWKLMKRYNLGVYFRK